MNYKIPLCLLLLLTAITNCYTQDIKKYNDPLLGENVFIFEPIMKMTDIQAVIDTLFLRQSVRRSEFSLNRYTLFFKPGKYNLDVKINYYMHVAGLGSSPEDVVITGAVRSNTTHGNSVLTNFWRAVENLTVIPSDSINVWGVSQASPMRRVHIKGNLQLFDKGYASGGFLADSKIDGRVTSGPQQQWFSRNSEWEKWEGGVWNMFFLGVKNAPAENWPSGSYTTINKTPLIREKPYIAIDSKGYIIKVPSLRKDANGISWEMKNEEKEIPLSDF
jgi:hypothetical protein